MAQTTATTCPYCGVGCGVLATPGADGQVAISGDPRHPANLGRLCSKGSALGETVDLDGRLLHPQIHGAQVDWDTALNHVADRLSAIIAEHGPDAVAFYVSGQLLTEDYYVANKLMKGFIGSGNIDTNSRLCMSSAVAGHKRAFGKDTVANCYRDLELADSIILIGSNIAWCHPVLYQRMQAASEGRDALTTVVIDPRRTASCEGATLHLALNPGTDTVLFNGLLVWLVEQGLHDQAWIDAHTEQFNEALTSARRQAPDIATVANLCGLESADVAHFFKLFARHQRTVSLFSQGVNQSTAGSDKVNSIINCHLACARIGVEGSGAFSITGQPNAMGGREVGGLANTLAAHMDFDDAQDIDRVARFWNTDKLATSPGLKAVDLFDAVLAGKVKAIWVMATNPVDSMPNADRIRAALQACELVIDSDCMANTDTARCADILLPATAWGEKEGTVTNSERCISRQRQFLPLPGEARHDWWILSQVARRMGFGEAFDYRSAAQIFREHAALSGFENTGERDFNIAGLAHINDQEYDEMTPRQWPLINGPEDSTPRLLGDGKFYTASGRARFVAITSIGISQQTCAQFPLVMNTGRVRDHWHSMTRTAKAPRLSRHLIEPFVELHPQDARRYRIQPGDLVQVRSRYADILVRAAITDACQVGQVFVPMHWNDQYASQARVDSLVASDTDAYSGQPGFKHTPVSVQARNFAWQGFLLTREALAAPQCGYWARAIEEGFWRYELAGDEIAEDWPQWLRRQLHVFPEAGQLLEYIDQSSGSYRAVWFAEKRLQGCLFVAASAAALPARDWLLACFDATLETPRQRVALLSGRAAKPTQEPGPVVCSCFNIGRNTITRAIAEQGLNSVEAIGSCLQAGSNCGSCKPELKALLEATPVAEALPG